MDAIAFRARKALVSFDDLIEESLKNPLNQLRGEVRIVLTIKPLLAVALKNRLENRGFNVQVQTIVMDDREFIIS